MEKLLIGVKTSDESLMPFYATKLAAGADLKANISESLILESGSSILVPTGLFLDIPEGYEVQIRPRSGLALKNGITVLNTPGTIDADYKGEIGVILINHSRSSFVIEPKMRIAQMVCAKVEQAQFYSIETLSTSARGEGGFGSSGLK
jgi:dUTP pyrophosphatase